MRANGFVTVVVPFKGDWGKVEELLTDAAQPNKGNRPNKNWIDALEQVNTSKHDRPKPFRLIHFLSMAVVGPRSPMDPENEPPLPSRGNTSYLMIEVSSDTGATETLQLVAAALEGLLVQVFDTAGVEWSKPTLMQRLTGAAESNEVKLARFMFKNRRDIGDEWGMALGQVHDGSPAMTVERIIAEKNLAHSVDEWIGKQRSTKDSVWLNSSPTQRLDLVRNWLWDSKNPEPTKWAFAAEPTPVLHAAPVGKDLQAILSIAHKLLWPLFILLTAILIGFFWVKRIDVDGAVGYPPALDWRLLIPLDWTLSKSGLLLILVPIVWLLRRPRQYPLIALVATTFVAIAVLDSFGDALLWSFLTSVAIALATAIVVIAAHFRLKKKELDDPIDDHAPYRKDVRALMKVENLTPQNHMFTVSTIKPGMLRRLALRYILTKIGANPFVSRPGFLGKNGVIHSARWLWIPDPKTPWFRGRLIFWSNFDGTWESYVGDFVADSPDGVTGLWSNCVGFPRTRNLTDEGAKNRDRLVRWARRQQMPTRFWYSAYPDLTNARIRINAAIRQGIASAQTDADARDWLSLFGSQPRPPGTLATNQIQTLVFGGLSRLPFASCHMILLSDDATERRAWLTRVSKEVTFGELLPGQTRAVALALSAGGLEKLDIPDNSLDTFPVPFQEGMWTDERARAIGDDDPSQWSWGSKKKDGTDKTADVFLVIYGATLQDVTDEERILFQGPSAKGLSFVHSKVLCRPTADDEDKRSVASDKCYGRATGPIYRTEHFGFADGISQPVIIGLRRSERRTAHNDRVHPGEIILGYPDNLGLMPPTPLIDATLDPDHTLADEDIDPLRARPDFSRYEGSGRRDLGANGTFLVVRHLEQHVDRWEEMLKQQSEIVFKKFVVSAGNGGAAIVWGDPKEVIQPATASNPIRVKSLYTRSVTAKDIEPAIAAKLMGRWKDGSPLVRNPMIPGGDESTMDNSFRFGIEDPQGLACPLGAHIRRANPRDTRFPGSQEEIDSVNRHRILRVGRPYGERSDEVKQVDKLGLMFMCLNADIERQYEFVQKSWMLNRDMNSLEGETDPLIGPAGMFSIPTPRGIVKIGPIKDLVTVRGGGYFFMPGAAALRFLCRVGEKSHGAPPPGVAVVATPQLEPVRAPTLVPAAAGKELETATFALVHSNSNGG